MRLAIVHYHLRRGGVTRVIETALEGLRQAEIKHEVVVLSGEAPYEGSPLEGVARVVPGLGYRNEISGIGEAGDLADALYDAALDAFDAPADLWHIHNHSLGKNVAMPGVLDRLLGDGARLLLQIHDFAEDGRPENFLRQRTAIDPTEIPWYPDAPQVHYALLNQRDAGFLNETGLASGRLHLLPNAVSAPPADADARPPAFVESDQRFFLYPTRGIRRKNLGEMLLLAALTGEDCAFASTLAPENPEWLAIHDRWADFAEKNKLPAKLGIGSDPNVSFGGLIGSADGLLTTSVAEGFGLAFLEPWLAGKTVSGRNLPEITSDFAENGIDLGGLYDRLEVPTDSYDTESFRAKVSAALERAFASYGRDLPGDAIESALGAATIDGGTDFGRLDESLQEQALEWILADPARARNQIDVPDLSPASSELADQNAAAVAENYSTAAYGQRLGDLYREVIDSPQAEPGALDGDRLLDAFLDPARFTLLRT